MTTAQRELTTELNFKYNPTNLNKFLGGVKSFKAQTVAAYAATAFAVTKVLSHFNDLAKTTLKINDIGEAAGFAAEEFLAWRDAAARAGISTENFEADFQKLSTTINEARVGTGEFFRIFRESGQKIRLPDALLSDADNFKRTLKDIFEYINTLPSESRKLQVLSRLFSPESAGRWKDAIAEGFDKFQETVELSRKQNTGLDSNIDRIKEYNKLVEALGTKWESFSRTLGLVALPAINKILDFANLVLTPQTEEERAKSQLATASVNSEEFRKNFMEFAKSNLEFFIPRSAQTGGTNNTSSLVTNNIEISVPPGTTEEQGVYMAEMVKAAISEAIETQTQLVISNNPQME